MIYRNPLNGQVLDAPFVGRVFAVTINNVWPALPHRGVSQADVLVEMLANDYCTRGLALFTDVEKLPSIGSIRSTRPNFTDLGLAYDLVVVHAQGSNVVLADMAREGLDNLNADSSIGYRDYDRYYYQDYDWEHTLFARGTDLIRAALDKGYDLEKSGWDYGMLFAETVTLEDGADAAAIKLVFTLEGHTKTTTLIYDAALGKYVWNQMGMEMIDENNGEKEAFTNVIILLTSVKTDGHGYHFAQMYGSGQGYYACGGKLIPIIWEHPYETYPFTFFLPDGTPLEQRTGNTYLAIAPLDSPVEWE